MSFITKSHPTVGHKTLWWSTSNYRDLSNHFTIILIIRIILRQLVINTLPSYTSVSNAAVGNTIYN